MVGRTVTVRRPFPLGALLWALGAIALDALSVGTGKPNGAALSVFPWLCAALLLAARQRPFRATFTEEALEVERPPLSLPYAEMQGLLAGLRRSPNPYQLGQDAYAIQVIHPGGVLTIPARLDVPSDEVYAFLFSRFKDSGACVIHPKLAEIYHVQQQRHGPGRVWCYGTREYLGLPRQYPRLRAFFLALLLAGAFWAGFGWVSGNEEWMRGGGPPAMLGLLFTHLMWVQSRPRGMPTSFQGSSLVISPEGFAVVQGSLEEALCWDEVRDVRIGRWVNDALQVSGAVFGTAITVKLDKKTIRLFDVYDRPLPLIHQLICYYWRGQDADEPAGTLWHFDPARLEVFVGEAGRPRREGEGITRGE